MGRLKTGKLLLGLMTHDVSCNIWVVWSKFAESTIKTWIELPLHQKFWAGGVVGCAGDCLLAHFGLFNNYWELLKFHLSIVADHMSSLMITLYPSCDCSFQQGEGPCLKAQVISKWIFQYDSKFTVIASTLD